MDGKVEPKKLEEVMAKVLADESRCIVCGDIIPEGRHVCTNCERKGQDGYTVNTGNPYYDYLIHEVQVVCECPQYKAMSIVSYVNSLGSDPVAFIKNLPEYVGKQHPDADEVLKALENIRQMEGVQKYGICFPEGYPNRKERRRQDKERKKANKLAQKAKRNGLSPEQALGSLGKGW